MKLEGDAVIDHIQIPPDTDVDNIAFFYSKNRLKNVNDI